MTPATDFHVEYMSAERLARLNSATKYPPIETYHKISGDNGSLSDERNADFSNRPRDVRISEKIDGANGRIIIPPRGYGGALFGSRDALIGYEHDVIVNPELAIVPTLLDVVDAVCNALTTAESYVVVYGEVYGHGVGKAGKNYSHGGEQARNDFAVFDIAVVDPSILERDREQISGWRKRGGQHFVDTGQLWAAANSLDTPLRLVPSIPALPPPSGVEATHAWLNETIGATQAALDPTLGARAEGVVVRTLDRSQVAKIRFADYERTARKRAEAAAAG